MSKKRKNSINVKEAIELFLAYGMRAKIHLPWELMIFPDESENRYDWYHTTGSLVGSNGFFMSNIGKFMTAEDALNAIKKRESKIHGN